MDWQSITAIATCVLALLMLLAFLVAWWKLKALAKTSRGVFLIRLAQLYNSDTYIKARVTIKSITAQRPESDRPGYLCAKLKKYAGSTKPSELDQLVSLLKPAEFFEILGFLVQRIGIPSKEDANRLFGGEVIRYYRLYEPYLTFLEEKRGTGPRERERRLVWENFKWLKEQLDKIRPIKV